MKRTFEKNIANYFRYSSVMSNAHYDMVEIYRKRHRTLGILVVVLTAGVGTSAFASLGKSDQQWIQGLTVALSAAAVVLASLQTFLRFPDLQAQHKTAADGYSGCRREIELLIMKFPTARGLVGEPGTPELESVKGKLDKLDQESPTIPDNIYNSASAKTPRDPLD